LPKHANTYGLLKCQFWDMRQPDLEKQSLDIQNKDEMHEFKQFN
jgi:hypothetical protein